MAPDTVLFYSAGTCSLGALVVLEWLGEPYRACRVDRSERPTPRYTRINPHGAVPAMKVDGRIVTENAAILTSLASCQGDLALLAARGTASGDRQNEWLSYLGTTFHPAFYPFFATARYSADEAHHPAIKAAAVAQIKKGFGFVNGRLAGKTWLDGERTVLDPYLYAMTRWGKRLFDIPAEFAEIARHQTMMEGDPAVRFALALEEKGEAVEKSAAFAGHVALDDA